MHVSSTYLQVTLPGALHLLHGAHVDLLQTLLPPLVLRLQLVQLHAQMLALLTELMLQLLQGRLRLRQLHLQTLLQQGNLQTRRTTSLVQTQLRRRGVCSSSCRHHASEEGEEAAPSVSETEPEPLRENSEGRSLWRIGGGA